MQLLIVDIDVINMSYTKNQFERVYIMKPI